MKILKHKIAKLLIIIALFGWLPQSIRVPAEKFSVFSNQTEANSDKLHYKLPELSTTISKNAELKLGLDSTTGLGFTIRF